MELGDGGTNSVELVMLLAKVFLSLDFVMIFVASCCLYVKFCVKIKCVWYLPQSRW